MTGPDRTQNTVSERPEMKKNGEKLMRSANHVLRDHFTGFWILYHTVIYRVEITGDPERTFVLKESGCSSVTFGMLPRMHPKSSQTEQLTKGIWEDALNAEVCVWEESQGRIWEKYLQNVLVSDKNRVPEYIFMVSTIITKYLHSANWCVFY